MDIVGGLDVHRKQITFNYVEIETGEVHREEISPATREHLCCWLSRFSGLVVEAAFALEVTTGWRFVVEELQRAGTEAHLAEPADTKALRGRKKRPKTDRLDARHLRELLIIERLPESCIPPYHIQEKDSGEDEAHHDRGAYSPPAAHPRPTLPQWLPSGEELARQEKT